MSNMANLRFQSHFTGIKEELQTQRLTAWKAVPLPCSNKRSRRNCNETLRQGAYAPRSPPDLLRADTARLRRGERAVAYASGSCRCCSVPVLRKKTRRTYTAPLAVGGVG